MDHNIQAAITSGVRRRGIDVLTALEDGMDERDDELLLDRATTLGRLLYTHDDDFLATTRRWLEAGRDFAGLAHSAQEGISFRAVIDDLESIARLVAPEEARNSVYFIPF
jgi:hypothetical protein